MTSSKQQIKIINDTFRRLLKEKYPNLTLNIEHNLYVHNLEGIINSFPIEKINAIREKNHIFGLYVCDEALHSYVDSLYKDLIIRYNLPESQILIVCSSPDYKNCILEKSKFYNKDLIKAEYISVFEHQQKQLFLWYMTGTYENTILNHVLPYKSAMHNTTFKKKFLCFNRRWKEYRFALLSLLFNKNLLDDGYISFSDKPVNSDDLYYGNPNAFDLFFNDTLKNYSNIDFDLKKGYDVKSKLPLVIDNNFFETYFAFDTNHRPIRQYFNNSYFSLVNETYFDTGNIRFLTEKVYKPIMHKHPFILASTPYSLELLREQGYMTFESVIDESYDKEKDNCKRLIKIANEVERLCKLSETELLAFTKQCLPIVEHNYNIFFNKQIEINTLL